MGLKLYNTLTRKKEVFKPIKKGQVGFYGCGPTVYWYQHIGNIRRYIFEDILLRQLNYNGFKVKHIINVTDVGHLTSDADEGEDKVEKAAKKEGKTAKEITRHYFDAFKEDLEAVNFTEPDKWTWATEHIKEQIDLIKELEKKDFIYKTSDGVYFDTSKFKDYTKFAKLDIKGLEAGKRITMKEKKNPTDFALWKFSSPEEKRQQEWDSPWGIGFPGWHIECSAMSKKYLGDNFDIHTGGIDHIPIHHTNEIAQMEPLLDKKPWVKYWLHSNHLNLKEGKMSKSKGDVLRIKNLEEKGYSPLAFRYLVLLTHYRKKIEFDFKLMDAAQTTYTRLKNAISEITNTPTGTSDKKTNKDSLKQFEDAMNNDLNTPKAIQVLWNLIKDKKAKSKIKTIKKMDEVFGLDLLKKEEIDISKEVQDLVKEREQARRNKDWKKSDELRDKISELGFSIDDTDEGSKIRLLDDLRKGREC